MYVQLMINKLLPISEAADYLGVSIQTLRRWHERGTFRATLVSEGGHRYYSLSDLKKLTKGLFQIAKDWVSAAVPDPLEGEFHCPTKDVFTTRLNRMALQFDSNPLLQALGPIVTSITGEIGNNSFDHNVGNWPDVLGSFFSYDLSKRIVVLADRGQGVLATLRRVKPELVDDEEALRAAFTLILTARAPEHRGNGLKFVRAMVTDFDLKLTFQSGTAELHLKKGDRELIIKKADRPIRGCLVLIKF